MNKLRVDALDVAGKCVLVRVDFNVPLTDGGAVSDDTRIRAALPTIRHLVDRGARVVLASHLGRPKGAADPRLSLRPAAARLSELLGAEVAMAPDCVGPEVEAMVKGLEPGGVLLLENVRFHAEETKNDEAFGRALAAGMDLYVNDAFGSAHRAHASTTGVARHVGKAAAGFLMEKEIRYLGGVLASPKRPFWVLLGGAKVSDKIGVIENLLGKADRFLIGGAMAYTFLKAQGHPVGRSLVEDDKLDLARTTLEKASSRGIPFLLPEDHVIADSLEAGAQVRTADGVSIPGGWIGLDIGPRTAAAYAGRVREAGLIVWNGPMGKFEDEAYAKGTVEIARAVAASTAVSIVGGGDSVKAIRKAGVADRITFISTGGGASLELLEGKELPGVVALTDAD